MSNSMIQTNLNESCVIHFINISKIKTDLSKGLEFKGNLVFVDPLEPLEEIAIKKLFQLICVFDAINLIYVLSF